MDWRAIGIGIFLFFGTLLLFSRAVRHDFLDLDDPDYVTQNGHVQAGLTWTGFCWAFVSTSAGNWHPVTWLSHMADWQMFGSNPHGHHATNVLLHAANAVLALCVWRRLTGQWWLSAIGAALFAWHPLRVESVAWIAERKDVLSGSFFLLTLLAYFSYDKMSVANKPRAKIYFGLALVSCALGLMCKPMLVTLPFVLLLLDFWPLHRFDRSRIGRVLIEKIPFFLLAVLVCVITYHAQKAGGAIVENLTPGVRLAHAAVAVTGYLVKVFWPFDLAVAYPLPQSLPTVTVVMAFLNLAAITGLAIWQMRVRPWLFVGWFWFLGMLVPVLGLVQAGDQAMADRYTYLPVLGLQLALLWTACEVFLFFRVERVGMGLAVLVLIGCAARTWDQLVCWQNSKELYKHALAVTKDNYLVDSNLGTTLFNAGDLAGAEQYFQSALEINPGFGTARFKLALVQEAAGHADAARGTYFELLKTQPQNVEANYNLAVLLLNGNQPLEAIPYFQTVVKSRKDNAAAYVGLGLAQDQAGLEDEALKTLQQAELLNPKFPGLTEALAGVRAKKARHD